MDRIIAEINIYYYILNDPSNTVYDLINPTLYGWATIGSQNGYINNNLGE